MIDANALNESVQNDRASVSVSESVNENERGANERRGEEKGLSRGPGPCSGPERVKTQLRKAQHRWPVVVGRPWCHCSGGSAARYGT